MELLYVWIEDYKNIKKQGFNFSPKHWFDYDEKTNTLKHEERNQNYPENFFGENISNVTAIVGKNGSGKSSIVSRILNSIQNPHETEGKYFIIVRNNLNEIKIHKIGVDVKSKLPSLFEDYLANPQWVQENTNLIYYSNDLLYGPPVIKDHNLKLRIDTVNIVNKDVFDISTNTLLQNNQTTGKYKSAALLNICNFFNEYEVVSNKIRLPGYFVAELPELNLDQLNIKGLIKNLVTKDNLAKHSHILTPNEYIEKWEVFCNDLQVWLHVNYTEQNFVDQINIQLFIAFIENHYTRLDGNLDALSDYFDLTNQSFETIPLSFFNRIKRDSSKRKVIFTKRIDAILDFMKFLEDKFQKKLRAIKDIESNTYKCHFNIKNKDELELLFEFINHLNEIKWPEKHTEDRYNHFNLLDYYFEYTLTRPSNFSSGEIALLHFLARLYHLKQINTGKELKNNIILIIDEGDLGYHPEWQREYLKIVITETSKIFKHHNLQIIVTSHSPFLVSDLPKENIIFLNKDENGLCEVKPPEDMTHTFGANIHSLYRNSFFLENGLMGEFAKGKIDRVIEDLNERDNNISEVRKKEIRFIIDQIGEPLIKGKLRQKYKARFEPIEDQINELKLKIERLEASRKN